MWKRKIREESYVFASVDFSVSRKLSSNSCWKFLEGEDEWLAMNDNILVVVWMTIRIQEIVKWIFTMREYEHVKFVDNSQVVDEFLTKFDEWGSY